MNIGFDAKRAAQNATGLGNYSRFIIDSVRSTHPEHQYFLYAPNPNKSKLLSSLSDGCTFRFPVSGWWKRFRSLWRVWGMTADLQQDNIHLFHGLSNELPLNIRKASHTKSIVTIHDLIFLRLPYCYKPIDRWIYNYKFRRACRHADRIIAVSECTKRDIQSFYHIAAEKIEVVYQGCDKAFREQVSEEKKREVSRNYHLPQRFILYVGSIERRKNLMLLAQALTLLPADYQVVAVGKHTPYADAVQRFVNENGLSDRFRMIQGVPFSDLPTFYQLAQVFVYPSHYEGFGIPLLEALCSGVPAIGATGSCLEEAGGPSSLYVAPDDAQGLAKAVRQCCEDETLRQQMIAEGKRYAERFTDDRLAAHVWQVYEKTLQA